MIEISKLDLSLNDRIESKMRDPYARTEEESHAEAPTYGEGNLILRRIRVSVDRLDSSWMFLKLLLLHYDIEDGWRVAFWNER
jgi:hypothetical protein